MASHRERLEAFARSLSEEEQERRVPNSDWRVKDFLIHLLTFDPEMVRWLEQVRAGDTGAPATTSDGEPYDIDAWNNAQVAERRDWPLDRLLAEGTEGRKQFEDALRTLEDEHIDQVVDFPGDNKRDPAKVQFKLFLGGLGRHDPIHVADIIKALPERADDPEIKAWIDDGIVRWYQGAMSGPPRR